MIRNNIYGSIKKQYLKTLSIYIFIFPMVCLGYQTLIAQSDSDQHDVTFTIPEIAIIDIEPNNTALTLSLDIPMEAGGPVTATSNGSDNTRWLNYSSCLSPSASNRNITVQITSGTVPPGIDLKLQAASYSGAGAGTFGTPGGLLILNNTAQTLISGIGAAYTGDGISNGHQLTFSLAIEKYGLLDFDNTAVIEVTYTITD